MEESRVVSHVKVDLVSWWDVFLDVGRAIVKAFDRVDTIGPCATARGFIGFRGVGRNGIVEKSIKFLAWRNFVRIIWNFRFIAFIFIHRGGTLWLTVSRSAELRVRCRMY